jgi:hypothetical protein
VKLSRIKERLLEILLLKELASVFWWQSFQEFVLHTHTHTHTYNVSYMESYRKAVIILDRFIPSLHFISPLSVLPGNSYWKASPAAMVLKGTCPLWTFWKCIFSDLTPALLSQTLCRWSPARKHASDSDVLRSLSTTEFGVNLSILI